MTQAPPQPTTAAAPGTAAPSQMVVLDVEGMKCAGCVGAVERVLTGHPGVEAATVNLVTRVAAVQCDGSVKPPELAQALDDAGFPSQPRPTDISPQQQAAAWAARQQQAERQQVRQVAIATTLLFLSTLGHLKHLGGFQVPILSDLWFHGGLATLALLLPGRQIIQDGWAGLRRGAPNMNTLVALGTLSAYSASVAALIWPQLGWECFFDEPVMLVSFILLGRTLEQRARHRASAALQALVALQPSLARLIPNPAAVSDPQAGVEIPASQVQQGEWLRVLPGERVPADGQIVDGQTTVDESMLTGESLPVLKQVGDDLGAGTLNQAGAVVLRVTRVGSQTVLARMIELVETAQTRKAPIQRFADRVAGVFTYGVLSLAALTGLFWYWVGTGLWPQVLHWGSGHAMTGMAGEMAATSPLLLSLKLAIAVLVIACPCALGLATPTAILVGSSLGAERGLLIRGGDVLETVHRLDTVIFDKTGTLTSGQPQVTTCLPWADLSADALIQLAASVEIGTRHPLAHAIQSQAQDQGHDLLSAQDFQTEPGLGVSATITWQGQPQTVRLGNAPWLRQADIDLEPALVTQADDLAAAGQTVVYISLGDQPVGLIAVADTLRPDAAAAVAALQDLGLSVQLLSGDQPGAAVAIAAQLGLPPAAVTAGVTPAGKVATLRALQDQGRTVAMVGDGINDAPAIAQADVGIALNSSSDVALETADIVLMREQLGDVVAAIRLSRATFNKIRQNLAWAFTYNLVGIPLAAGVLLPVTGLMLSPAIAGGLMAFSSVSVVLNSLLLRRQQL